MLEELDSNNEKSSSFLIAFFLLIHKFFELLFLIFIFKSGAPAQAKNRQENYFIY